MNGRICCSDLLQQIFKGIVKRREGHIYTMAVQDFGMPLGSQSRNTECHGDSVVKKCVDGCPMQGIAAPDHHAVGGGDGITAHGFQIVGDGFDAV